jgi:hypothetical protein
MADDVQLMPGNYVNPDYATPEQLARLRAYSNYLLAGKGQQEVHRPLQGVSNIVSALVGGYQGRQADQMQNQALQRSAARDSALIDALINRNSGRLDGGLPAPPQIPMSSTGEQPQPRAAVPATPQVWGDQEGQAAGIYPPSGGSASPPAQPSAGGALPQPGAAPMSFAPPPGTPQTFAQMYQNRSGQGRVDPRLLGATLNDPLVSPEQKAMVRGLIAPVPGQDVAGQPTLASPLGGMNAQNVGPGVQPGVLKSTTISPEGITAPTIITPGQGGPQVNTPAFGGNGLQGAIGTMNQLSFNKAVSGSLGVIAQQDAQLANEAINIKRSVGTILDDIATHGDKMSFGPQSPWVNDIKRVAANFAPGLMKDQLGAIAASDSMDKMTANLAGLLSKQMATGEHSDAQLFNAMKSVPGLLNSKEGATAMAKMIMQTADLQQALGKELSNGRTSFDWQQIKSNFWATHPINNPLTGNPIQLDVQNAERNRQTQTPQRGGGWGYGGIVK